MPRSAGDLTPPRGGPRPVGYGDRRREASVLPYFGKNILRCNLHGCSDRPRGSGSMMRRCGCPCCPAQTPRQPVPASQDQAPLQGNPTVTGLHRRPRVNTGFRASADFLGTRTLGPQGGQSCPTCSQQTWDRHEGSLSTALVGGTSAGQFQVPGMILRTTRVGAPSPALSCYQVGAGSR